MSVNILGIPKANNFLPYTQATKRTKEIDIKSSVSIVTGVSNPVIQYATAVFTADSSNNWSVRVSFEASFTSATYDAILLNVSGLVFDSSTRYRSVGAGYFSGPATVMLDTANSSRFYVERGAAVTGTYVTGTFTAFLASEPTWASLGTTAAAALESPLAVDVYIPPAAAGIQGLVDNTSGNTVGTPIKGRTDGQAVASGYVGDFQENITTTGTITSSTPLTWFSIMSKSVGAGTYLVFANARANSFVTSQTEALLSINTTIASPGNRYISSVVGTAGSGARFFPAPSRFIIIGVGGGTIHLIGATVGANGSFDAGESRLEIIRIA